MHLFAFRKMPGERSHFGYADVEPYVQTLRTPGTVDYILRVLGTWEQDMRQLQLDIDRESLSMPTLLLWGDRDIVVPVATASALLAHIKRGELITLPGIGHLPNEEAPEAIASLIRTWLIWRDTKVQYMNF